MPKFQKGHTGMGGRPPGSKNKRLAKLEQQKIDKVYEINKKEGPDKSKFPELAKQIADLDAEIKKVNDEIKADETWKTHVEKKG